MRVAILLLGLCIPGAAQTPVDLGEGAAWSWGGHSGFSLDVQEQCDDRTQGCVVIRNEGAPVKAFAYLTQSLDAAALRGKQVRFSAALRFDYPGLGQGQLFMRVDRPAGGGFQGYSSFKGVRELGWTEQEITGRIDEDAVQVTIGVRFAGRGATYFADPGFEQVFE